MRQFLGRSPSTRRAACAACGGADRGKAWSSRRRREIAEHYGAAACGADRGGRACDGLMGMSAPGRAGDVRAARRSWRQLDGPEAWISHGARCCDARGAEVSPEPRALPDPGSNCVRWRSKRSGPEPKRGQQADSGGARCAPADQGPNERFGGARDRPGAETSTRLWLAGDSRVPAATN
jgi:hypothetical protein